AAGARLGDTLDAAGGYDPQLRIAVARRKLVLVGRAHFLYLPAGARAVALPIRTLQTMQGDAARDRASLFMVKARQGADVETVRARIERALPRVTVVSTETAMRQVDERL